MIVLFGGEYGAIDTLRFIEEKLGIGLSDLDIDPRSGDWSRGLYSRAMRWSTGVYRLLGLEPRGVEPSYSLLESLIHPDDRKLPSDLDDAMHAAEPQDREFRIIQPKGTLRWLHTQSEVLLDEKGVPIRRVSIWSDVTARREARETITEQQQRFQSLVRASCRPVWLSRPDGIVVDIFGWQELTGQALAEALGMGWLECVHPEDRQATLSAWNQANDRSQLYEVEHRIRMKSGEYRWFKSRSIEPGKPNGAVVTRVGVSTDIHDEKMWPRRSDDALLTGAQIRAARGILNWSVRDLSEATAVSPSTIRRLEETDGVPSGPKESATEIKNSLRSAGIEFFIAPSGKRGVSPN
ncbi:MAG: PAS domain-containing protein [Hyphomicrobiales bacterium]|nr:PAS domain-containing protein [Hyphomicrobiales bacterium]MBV9741029.1 PAS domain-containing protein [Hyphomicrobiales bacterium]